MWKIIKIIPIDKLERVRLGLESIRRANGGYMVETLVINIEFS